MSMTNLTSLTLFPARRFAPRHQDRGTLLDQLTLVNKCLNQVKKNNGIKRRLLLFCSYDGRYSILDRKFLKATERRVHC